MSQYPMHLRRATYFVGCWQGTGDGRLDPDEMTRGVEDNLPWSSGHLASLEEVPCQFGHRVELIVVHPVPGIGHDLMAGVLEVT
jgi:hypothetical protein